ncbi:unnamed protein product [Adineta steineri]|uniref:Uncharacterized protein n=1 Tax=Adineta steineri TaxID=433720 RepID=A0A815G5V1_9BILA|nr:unnamed protein product [Adineta steineri]CAF3630964.1 unnamed protein product [Adineta steineri]CAF4287264.1 unnamed protein product [Adineta steineri]
MIIFSIPFAILQVYFLASANWIKDAYRQTLEQFILLFFNVFLTVLYADSFYCYCAASKRYREQVLNALKYLFACGNQRRNRVVPIGESLHLTATLQQQGTTVH